MITLVPAFPDGVPDPEYNPYMTANLVCRLVLCPIALVACWVPFRLLQKHGEFAAAVLTAANCILVLYTLINAAIWTHDDLPNMWNGEGWCDFHVYTWFPLSTIYGSSTCAIMRRLAQQVSLSRVTDLSAKERRNHIITQCLIIFPVALLQLALIPVVQLFRYSINPVSGCDAVYDRNVVLLVFFILPTPIYTVAACFHAGQTFVRFRKVRGSTRAVLNSANSEASARSLRAARKLYAMTTAILVPYTILEFCFLGYNLVTGWPWTRAPDVYGTRNSGFFDIAVAFRYTEAHWLALNVSWVPVVSVAVICLWYSTSAEAVNTYREYLLAVGLGCVWPRLREPFTLDTRASSRPWNSVHSEKMGTSSSKSYSVRPSVHHVSQLSDSAIDAAFNLPSTGSSGGHSKGAEVAPDYSAGEPRCLASKVPRLFNPGLNWSTAPKLPPLGLFKKSKKEPEQAGGAGAAMPATQYGIARSTDEKVDRPWAHSPDASALRTNVWSGDGAASLPDGGRARRQPSVRVDTYISSDVEDEEGG